MVDEIGHYLDEESSNPVLGDSFELSEVWLSKGRRYRVRQCCNPGCNVRISRSKGDIVLIHRTNYGKQAIREFCGIMCCLNYILHFKTFAACEGKARIYKGVDGVWKTVIAMIYDFRRKEGQIKTGIDIRLMQGMKINIYDYLNMLALVLFYVMICLYIIFPEMLETPLFRDVVINIPGWFPYASLCGILIALHIIAMHIIAEKADVLEKGCSHIKTFQKHNY